VNEQLASSLVMLMEVASADIKHRPFKRKSLTSLCPGMPEYLTKVFNEHVCATAAFANHANH